MPETATVPQGLAWAMIADDFIAKAQAASLSDALSKADREQIKDYLARLAKCIEEGP